MWRFGRTLRGSLNHVQHLPASAFRRISGRGSEGTYTGLRLIPIFKSFLGVGVADFAMLQNVPYRLEQLRRFFIRVYLMQVNAL